MRFLIDVNLPRNFALWHGENFLHVRDLDDEMLDSAIWSYAAENGYTVVSKDADFRDRLMLYGPPPKVIHIRLRNMKMKQLHQILNRVWPEIENLAVHNALIVVFADRVEAASLQP